MILLVFLLRIRPGSSIFTSALVATWLSFLLWSALASHPDQHCNTLFHSNAATIFQIILWFGWTFITLFLLAIATASEKESKGGNAVSEIVGEDQKEVDDPENKVEIKDKEGKAVDTEEIYVFPVTKQTLVFQIILMLVTCHYGMVMTNWGNPTISDTSNDVFANNLAAFWIKIGV
jgi:hypothetical protein